MRSEKADKIYKIIMLVMLTALITFIITSIVLYNVFQKNGIKYVTVEGNTSKIGKTLQTFKNFIDKHYIGKIDENKLLESTIKGYINGLEDPYSEYITSDEMSDYMADTTGKFVGIGVYMANNSKANQIVVLMPIEGTPAAEKLKSGDVITKIDGVEYKGEQLSEASDKLKGEEGTKVKLEILRDNNTLEFEIERKTIKENHLGSKIINNNIGYIQIPTFDEDSYDEFIKIYEDLKSKNIKSLIIDLRNNGGGIVKEAVNIADIMVEKDKTLLITASKDKEEKINKSEKDKVVNVPVVVLVNENTASASEILAAALKENNGTKIVGKKTYGKGVIQTIYKLTDGSGLKLTTDEYFTPNHNSINKIGIEPDYEVNFPENKSIYNIEEKDDTQLQKAIELLK